MVIILAFCRARSKRNREYLRNEFSFALTFHFAWRLHAQIIFRWREKRNGRWEIMFTILYERSRQGSGRSFLRDFQWATAGSRQMDIEIIAVSRYGCLRRLLRWAEEVVSAVARRMEIKLALFVRLPSVPTWRLFFTIVRLCLRIVARRKFICKLRIFRSPASLPKNVDEIRTCFLVINYRNRPVLKDSWKILNFSTRIETLSL